jgi:hypothetical protein
VRDVGEACRQHGLAGRCDDEAEVVGGEDDEVHAGEDHLDELAQLAERAVAVQEPAVLRVGRRPQLRVEGLGDERAGVALVGGRERHG